MTPLEIAMPCLAGYLAGWLTYARAAYRHVSWDSYTSDGEKVVFSLMQGFVWPVCMLIVLASVFVVAPTRTERKIERRNKLEQDIRRLERELSLGGPPSPAPVVPPLPDTLGALFLLWLTQRIRGR